MKRMTCVGVILLGLAIATAPAIADSDARSVTGAAKGLFGGEAALGGVTLEGVELGTGVFIEADGSAAGTFHAVLQGSSLGVPQEITVEGKVSEGSVAADGRASFSGTASLDFGNGAPPLPGVAFSVIAGADGLVLAIDSTTLPAAALTAGAVTIE
ncbi:MAG TPA: hypothetical protein VJ813_15360 [Vicinamibacterales bacterium]|nr:hypothetical protein [Vicinamibacterales bacterium]